MDLQELFSDKYFKLLAFGAFAISSLILVKKKYLSGASFDSKACLKNQTVLITGANSGIGLATAHDLAKRGSTVILACRDPKSGQTALNRVQKSSKNPNVFLEIVDLSSLDSVKQFSKVVLDKFKNVNILINNAGVMACPYQTTEDGFEYQFQVNYLGHYLLTRLLLENICNNSPARIINVTSKLYESSGQISFDNLNMSTETYNRLKAYKISKLCNILMSNYLVDNLNKNGRNEVGVYSVSPGIVLTKLGRYSLNTYLKKALAFIFYPVIYFLMKTPREGAQTVLYCALEKDLKSGFYRDCKQNELKPHAADKDTEQKLWVMSESLVKKWL